MTPLPFAAAAALAAALAPEPRYDARGLDCARFLETVRSEIRTETGGRRRAETAGRTGVWVLSARDSAGGVALEGWFDSLAVWRTSPEGRLEPDTDGILGGRYRGRLAAAGGYLAADRPFVPDDVAQVAELGSAMDDLLPPLPGRPLAPGERWSDSAGMEIRRLPDSAGADGPLWRFELVARRHGTATPVHGDTALVPVDQTTREEGRFVWDPARGLVSRDRRIVVDTEIPPGGRIRRAVRSTLEQVVTLTRLPPAEPRGCRASGR